MVGDVGLAEDLAQDALVAALEQWPASGVPDNPGAWLMATAKHRAIDQLRRRKMLDRKHEHLGRELEERQVSPEADLAAAIDDHVGDDLLRLIFTTCHPVLTTEARVALTLRLLGGLTTDEIARAFLQPRTTIQQRIVRAKRTLAAARVPFEVPPPAELGTRLESVLEVIYLVFNEGYSATAGEDWVRPALCEDALRLGRILAELAPDEAEVHGLDPGVPDPGSRRARWRAHSSATAGSGAVGSPAHYARAGRAGARRGARRGVWTVRPPGRHRGVSRARAHPRGNRLDPHCGVV